MGNVKQYRKKPVVIEALQFTAIGVVDWETIFEFCPNARPRNGELFIKTLEGDMHVSPNDYIIKGVKDEFYPCKPDIFKATYDEVATPTEATPKESEEA